MNRDEDHGARSHQALTGSCRERYQIFVTLYSGACRNHLKEEVRIISKLLKPCPKIFAEMGCYPYTSCFNGPGILHVIKPIIQGYPCDDVNKNLASSVPLCFAPNTQLTRALDLFWDETWRSHHQDASYSRFQRLNKRSRSCKFMMILPLRCPTFPKVLTVYGYRHHETSYRGPRIQIHHALLCPSDIPCPPY